MLKTDLDLFNQLTDMFIATATKLSRLADHNDRLRVTTVFAQFRTALLISNSTCKMLAKIFITICILNVKADDTTEDIQYLSQLPLEKLLTLKSSLKELVTPDYANVTVTTPTYLDRFGAQAMAMQGPPIKRGDYEESLYKKDGHSKISNIFSMSVTTLAFLAFGGYLLCLIVQAVKSKQNYAAAMPVAQPTTFLLSAGIKKRPQSQFTSYGRRRRDNRLRRSLREVDLPPEQLFAALLQLCEGYAKWSDGDGVGHI